jgi:NAD(P)-dependent dehydrogenase (short-subunit alcohol dehydrogenase family)
MGTADETGRDGPTKTSPLPRVVLVTGAGGGLGRALALALKAQGYQVFGTSRRPEGREAGTEVPLLPLDVRLEESVGAAIDEVRRRADRLDVLVNNAAYRFHGAVEETSIEEARALFETNFLGMHRVTRAVLPILRRSSGGRIVNISSLAGLNAPPFGAVYAASKAALEAYSEALWHEVRPLGIHVSLIEPGPLRSEGRDTAVQPKETIAAYDGPRQRALDAIRRAEQTGRLLPAHVAECVVRVVSSRSPRLRYRVGAEASWLPRLKSALPWTWYVKGVRRKYDLDER